MNPEIFKLIDKLNTEKQLEHKEWIEVIDNQSKETMEYASNLAVQAREPYYGKKVFIRGLIEFTNICKNDCYYCGIQKSNLNVHRYRLTPEQIMNCCKEGFELGLRTFVLQGGEDPYYTDDRICDLVYKIKSNYPGCAITLSIGEKAKESYAMYKQAGADRYLLRHETANETHYKMLHPQDQTLENRKRCLYDLKDLGYQIGAGFMVGSPFQTSKYLADDMVFLKQLDPDMIGIGPFIPHHDTRFADMPAGTLDQTLYFLSLLRIMSPHALIPATTALGTIDPLGREKGMQAGANVVMPNLSPTKVRKDYLLYDNKICTGDESAQHYHNLEIRMNKIGYKIESSRGDVIRKPNEN